MKKNGLVTIGPLLVDTAIFTTPFICDVDRYKCESACCYRACIITGDEAKRIEKHLPGILRYLPKENIDFIKSKGSFVADCKEQPRCLGKCEIDEDEAMAVRRLFGEGEEFRCTWLLNDRCVLLYNGNEGLRYCAVHSYALEAGLTWEEFKMIDCVQYPLAIYILEGQQVLGIQSTPYLADIPCKNRKDAPLMYKSLKSTIRLLVGSELAGKITAYGDLHYK